VTKYHIQVYSDSLLTNTVISDSTVADTSYLLKNLSNNQTYWWRVRAKNVGGWGLFSTVNRLIVRIPTTGVLPSSFTMTLSGASFKNGCLRYGIPKQCFVSLIVYNLKGRAVRHYVSMQQSPGFYTVYFNEKVMAAGRYIMRFAAGDYDRIIPLLNF
jgi:hypothetical protein